MWCVRHISCVRTLSWLVLNQIIIQTLNFSDKYLYAAAMIWKADIFFRIWLWHWICTSKWEISSVISHCWDLSHNKFLTGEGLPSTVTSSCLKCLVSIHSAVGILAFQQFYCIWSCKIFLRDSANSINTTCVFYWCQLRY